MSFDEFWKVYPKKVGIGNARGQWPWAINKAPAETIIRGAIAFAAHSVGEQWRFLPSPAKWLIDERWNDVYPSPPSIPDPDLELKAKARIIARGDKFGLDFRERQSSTMLEEMVSKGYLTKEQAGR